MTELLDNNVFSLLTIVAIGSFSLGVLLTKKALSYFSDRRGPNETGLNSNSLVSDGLNYSQNANTEPSVEPSVFSETTIPSSSIPDLPSGPTDLDLLFKITAVLYDSLSRIKKTLDNVIPYITEDQEPLSQLFKEIYVQTEKSLKVTKILSDQMDDPILPSVFERIIIFNFTFDIVIFSSILVIVFIYKNLSLKKLTNKNSTYQLINKK